MIETGHHKPWEIAETIRKNSRWQVRKLIFVHHGRDLLNNPQESMHKTNQAWGKEAEYAFDGMIIEL